jgi:hypothetical protein
MKHHNNFIGDSLKNMTLKAPDDFLSAAFNCFFERHATGESAEK